MSARTGAGATHASAGASATIAAVACALLCAAAVALAALRARPSDRQQIVRLLERALDPEAHFTWQADPIPATPPVQLQRWRYRGHRAGWLLLDERGAPVAPGDRAAAAWAPQRFAPGGGSDELLRFPTGRGALALVVPMSAQRLLRITARARRAAPAGTVPDDRAALQGSLVVQPLQQRIDLPAELARRSYAELINDPRVRVAAGQLWSGAPTPGNGALETTSLTLLTPPSTQALLLQFSAGDGSANAPLDLDEIAIEDESLRSFFALGAPPRAESSLARAAPIDARELGLLPPPDPAWPALRKVEHLLERRDALLLPPPASASFEVDLPEGDLVLEYGIARVHEARRAWNRGAIELALRVEPTGGGPRVDASETLPSDGVTGWQDRSLDVSSLAGRRVRVTIRATPERGVLGGPLDLVAVGAPLVRRRAPRDPRRNVIVVSLDTVRADHLSCQGYPRPTTPHLDSLAQDAAWFRDASTTSSYTLPAHGSLLTGQLPSRHGAESVARGRNRIWSDRSDLLAVRLREEGWLTAAYTGGVYLSASFGFDQGFDRYDATDLLLEPDDPRAVNTPRAGDPPFNARYRESRRLDQAIDWVRAHRDGRFLLFLHTYVVHDYLAAPEHDARFHGSCASAVARGDLGFVRDRTLAAKPTAADLDHFVDSYDAALHEADAAIGRLVDSLREMDLLDSTLLVVTSDHGEEFGDHGGVNHGRTLHEEVLRVPLIVRAPGLAPVEVASPVSLADVTPTLLELLGIAPRHEMDGRSLVPWMRGDTMAEAPLQAELNLVPENGWAVRREGALKAIGVLDARSERSLKAVGATRIAPRRMLFRPPLDPRESRDLAGEDSDPEAARLGELLERLDAQRDEMRERRKEAKRAASGEHTAAERFDVIGGGYAEPPDESDESDEGGDE